MQLELSEKNLRLLEKAKLQDIQSLIQGYKRLEILEYTLFYLILVCVVMWILYLGAQFLRKKRGPSPQSFLRKQLAGVLDLTGADQAQFLQAADGYIRTFLRMQHRVQDTGLTDTELFSFFRGTPLEQKGAKSFALIEQGRFGERDLDAEEKEAIAGFLVELEKTAHFLHLNIIDISDC